MMRHNVGYCRSSAPIRSRISDTLLVEIVAFHEPDTDVIEEVRGLVEEVKASLSTIANE